MVFVGLNTPRLRFWSEMGLCVGLLLLALNWIAALVPFLSGPVFHPVGILVGAVLLFVCAALLGGEARDSKESLDRLSIYGDDLYRSE